MRELRSRDVKHRVTGLPALERRARALALALFRYGQHRARTRDEHQRAARLLDGLVRALDANTKDGAP